MVTKNIEGLTSILKYLILIILGSCITLFILYFRLIYERLPRQLFFFYTENNILIYNKPIIIFVFIFLIMSIIIIIITIRGILDKPIKIKPTAFILFILKVIKTIYDSLYTVYCFITNKIPDGFNKIQRLIMLFFNSKLSKFEYLVFPQLIIRSIICLCFLIDVFVFFEFKYFYKALSLLMINILIELWIFVIKEWCTTNIYKAKDYLHITTFNEGLENESHNIKFSEKYKYLNLDLDYHIQIYSNLLTMVHYSEHLENYKSYYTKIFNLIYYALFLIGCIYIIIKNLI